jgi:molecular chaperone DnaK (HSP70)
MATSDYYIGIDLGTSNCALAYINKRSASKRSQVLPIQQLISSELIDERALLPSVLYAPVSGTESSPESNPDERRDSWVVGWWAQTQLEYNPERVVASSKSWFTHAAVDRTAKILPQGESTLVDDQKLSPVDAAAILLKYLKDAWNKQPGLPEFNDQSITITLPASFDEAAQELTRSSAKAAGYPTDVLLIEEPQAAFYYFLEEYYSLYARNLLPRSPLIILVCDIGGGTTDFSLFEINKEEILERIDVSSHILLGGDNIDLAITKYLEDKCSEPLSRRQWHTLLAQSRQKKEKILGNPLATQEEHTIVIPPEGSSLFAKSIQCSFQSRELIDLVLDNFFPPCSSSTRVARSGLRDLGLPYATESAFTRQLANFLKGRRVDALLCTGGTLVPEVLQKRIAQALESWQETPLQILPNNAMHLAVARGAARYRLAKSGEGLSIKSGYPHALYLVTTSEQDKREAVCILPKGASTIERYSVDSVTFEALLGTEVQFQIVSSSAFPNDRPGARREIRGEFHVLPNFSALLSCALRERGSSVRVTLSTTLSELENLCISCHREGSAQSWDVLLQIRSGEKASVPTQHHTSPYLSQGLELLDDIWGKGTKGAPKGASPRNVLRELEKVLRTNRDSWTAPLLRSLWSGLLPGLTRRNRSLAHEEQFFITAGFLLRPGYGVELDDIRLQELWRTREVGLAHPKEKRILVQWWIMWRRVAGGLTSSQQSDLFKSVEHLLFKEPEALRLSASFEYLPASIKERLAGSLAKQIGAPVRDATDATPSVLPSVYLWSLERLINRNPLYSGCAHLISAPAVQGLYDKLEDTCLKHAPLAKVFLSGFSSTNAKEYDVSAEYKRRLETILVQHKLPTKPLWEPLVKRSEAELAQIAGDTLPHGLKIVSA